MATLDIANEIDNPAKETHKGQCGNPILKMTKERAIHQDLAE